MFIAALQFKSLMMTTEWCIETSDSLTDAVKLLDMTQQPSHTELYKIPFSFLANKVSFLCPIPIRRDFKLFTCCHIVHVIANYRQIF